MEQAWSHEKKPINIKCFKSMLMKFFSLPERALFSIHDPTGVKLLKKVWLKFCHLNKHKFRHNFKDTAVTMCNCWTETATAEHFFLCCSFFVTKRQKLLNNVYDKHFSSQNLDEESMKDILLHECNKFN